MVLFDAPERRATSSIVKFAYLFSCSSALAASRIASVVAGLRLQPVDFFRWGLVWEAYFAHAFLDPPLYL